MKNISLKNYPKLVEIKYSDKKQKIKSGLLYSSYKWTGSWLQIWWFLTCKEQFYLEKAIIVKFIDFYCT